MIKEYTSGKTYICKLKHGDDLLESIHAICKEKDITMGSVQAIGALQALNIAYYEQNEKKYYEKAFNSHYEILALIGNISLKDGSPICHAHIVAGDADGAAFGGHLVKGCVVFACELIISELKGPALSRGLDAITGLPLWDDA